jgi:hypothetical protein
MNAADRTASDGDALIETFVAELTATAYAVVLRHGAEHLWLDLELDLWEALHETVRRWRRACPADENRNPGHPVP